MKEENEDILKPWMVWTIAIVVCVLVWVFGAAVTRWYASHYASSVVNNAAGLFGDSFGAVNALISALAFAGVIVTFYLQRKELDLQRQELKAQREEFEQQNKTLKLQRFESTFFHMMELQQQIVSDLYIKVSEREKLNVQTETGFKTEEAIVDKSVRGRQVIQYIYRHAESVYYNDGIFDKIVESGLDGYVNAPYRMMLDHYFRHLYTILRYVDETDAFSLNDDGELDIENEWKQKYHYTTIVRATLSRHELLMLYYNGLSIFGREKLKPLIEKYSLLNNLDIHYLSLSKEYQNDAHVDIKKSDDWYTKFGLSGRDYEYYLTESDNDLMRYNVRAFGHRDDEIAAAKNALRNFERMMEERSKIYENQKVHTL